MSQVHTDNSIRALQQTGTAVQKLFTQLPTFVDAQLEAIQANANTIADQTAKIEAGHKAIEVQAREAAAEIRLRVREDADEVLHDLLEERQLVSMKVDDYRAKQVELQEALNKAQQKEFDSTKAAVDDAVASYEAIKRQMQADHQVALANYKAKAESDATTIELLKKQIVSLEATIVANRDAEIEKAKAAAGAQPLVVNTGK